MSAKNLLAKASHPSKPNLNGANPPLWGSRGRGSEWWFVITHTITDQHELACWLTWQASTFSQSADLVPCGEESLTLRQGPGEPEDSAVTTGCSSFPIYLHLDYYVHLSPWKRGRNLTDRPGESTLAFEILLSLNRSLLTHQPNWSAKSLLPSAPNCWLGP